MKGHAVLRMPKTIHYGSRAFEEVGVEAALRGKRALIISDGVMNKLGNVSVLQKYLTNERLSHVVYLGVVSEPTDVYVAEALALFRQEKCDVIISIGGGSCIDTAKAVSVLATNGGYIGDYMGGNKLAETEPIAHIAIPTTAGTGSEATDATVITNTVNDVKMMIKQPAFMPAVAMVDPLLSMSSPQHVTAATGVDALSHAIEAYISKLAHPLTDMMALSAMKRITENIIPAFADGADIAAREAMALGSLQAGIAFSNASVCLVHGMSRPIGALFHVPHGYSNAMLLPAVLDFSKETAIERLADLGNIFSRNEREMANEEAAGLAVSSVNELCMKLEIPNLREWGIDRTEFENAIGKMAKDAVASGSPANNPRVPAHEEIEELYRVCYDYAYTSESKIK
ncbi:iron-containing alcohol dehydrogenase [Virgibacillus halophilus]|uniref:iron-containing alcohol dehydrogenase n=1 Tax=Tigheibacillus halophilus TaxID=361280 RepID=UPI003642BBD9